MKNRYNNRRLHGCTCRTCQNAYKVMDFMPSNPMLANAYVPFQEPDELFCPREALENGTMFPELVSPYCKNQSQEVIGYLRQTKTCEEVDSNEL